MSGSSSDSGRLWRRQPSHPREGHTPATSSWATSPTAWSPCPQASAWASTLRDRWRCMHA
eukprot:3735795-Pleurochrysis_carterae.AAC.1